MWPHRPIKIVELLMHLLPLELVSKDVSNTALKILPPLPSLEQSIKLITGHTWPVWEIDCEDTKLPIWLLPLQVPSGDTTCNGVDMHDTKKSEVSKTTDAASMKVDFIFHTKKFYSPIQFTPRLINYFFACWFLLWCNREMGISLCKLMESASLPPWSHLDLWSQVSIIFCQF